MVDGRVGDPHDLPAVVGLGDLASDALVVANEFAEVTVRRVGTGNGVRLEVRSTRLGRGVLLDPLQLECLTWQQPSLYSELLREPFGPDGHKQEPGEGDGSGR